MAKTRKVPELRFKGFTEEWEEKKYGSLADIRRGLTYKPNDVRIDGVRVLRSSNIDEDTFAHREDDVFVSEKAVNIDFAQREDILITSANGSSRLVGKHAIIRNPSEKSVHGGFMLLSRAKNPDFLNASMSSRWYRTFIGLYVAGGNGAIGNLSKTDLEEQFISAPKEQEQFQIGCFFKNLDVLIALHQRKHDKLSTVKKAMLEKMFPKEGEVVPEIRFKGYTGKWERRKLGESCESLEYGLNAAAMNYDGTNKYIRITDIDDESHEFRIDDITTPDTDLNCADKYKIQEGDILFARTGASVGKTYIYNKRDGVVYFAGFLIRARINRYLSAAFIFQNTLTKQYTKFVKVTSQRSGQPGINVLEYGDFCFMNPQRDEQDKIASFFQYIDSLISLHKRELDKLKNIKKACLEKMFIC